MCILSTVTEYRYHFEFCSAYFIRITDTRHGPAPRAMALAMAPARAGSVTDGAWALSRVSMWHDFRAESFDTR